MPEPDPGSLDQALREARDEIARRCAVRISEDDPAMALLIGHEVMARHQARLAREAMQGGAEAVARRFSEMERTLSDKLRRDLAKIVEDSAALFQEAALRERADFIGALKTLTQRQEKAARLAREAARRALFAALAAIVAAVGAGALLFWTGAP